MGVSIYYYLEKKNKKGVWEECGGCDEIMPPQTYYYMGWLGGAKNYSQVPPIAANRTVPKDSSIRLSFTECDPGTSGSWVDLSELVSFNYDAVVVDRCCSKAEDGSLRFGSGGTEISPMGEGRLITYRELLVKDYFEHLKSFRLVG